jgi:WD40 repeat protein
LREGHTQRVLALAFSVDGRYLVSGGADASAIVWDLSKKGK